MIKKKHTLLCVDDEVHNVEALERIFRPKYKVLKALSGPEALSLLASHPDVSLIISDERMPAMRGVEFLSKSQSTHPFAMRFLLTGYTDLDSVVQAINEGQIQRYLTKPWDPIDLKATIDQAIETLELKNQVFKQNEALKSLDQAKNEFIILMNHELKTPLTTILNTLQLLEIESFDPETTRHIKHLNVASLRLKKLISDSMHYLQALTGSKKINKTKLEAKNIFILSDMHEVLCKLKAQRKIRIDQKIEPCKIFFDPIDLKETFSRLLENALKFTPEGETITIHGRKETNVYTLSIKNPAPKPLKTETELLKPFSLGENPLYHKSGYGLGLALAQAIMTVNGGTLHINTKNGFTVTLEFETESH